MKNHRQHTRHVGKVFFFSLQEFEYRHIILIEVSIRKVNINTGSECLVVVVDYMPTICRSIASGTLPASWYALGKARRPVPIVALANTNAAPNHEDPAT